MTLHNIFLFLVKQNEIYRAIAVLRLHVEVSKVNTANMFLSVTCAGDVEIEHGFVTTGYRGQNLPGTTLTVLCDDAHELQYNGRPYEYSSIVCNKNGDWDAYDGAGVLPVCQGEDFRCSPNILSRATCRLVP